LLEPGVYPAIFDRLEEPNEEGQYGPFLNWHFTVTTEDDTVEVLGRSSKPEYFTRATKARQWFEAILGRDLKKGESADPNTLRGTRVKLTLDIVKTERGDERNRIVGIRRSQEAEGKVMPVQSSSTVDPAYEAYKAEQAAKKAAVEAANAEEPPPPEPHGEDQGEAA
jgi:hypothetical protein